MGDPLGTGKGRGLRPRESGPVKTRGAREAGRPVDGELRERLDQALRDPEVAAALAGDFDEYIVRAAERMVREHPNSIVVNCCPACGKIVRTPKARPCLWCGHGWHGERESARPRRFHGSVQLDSTRVGRDASRIADEVLCHLSGLIGANVRVTLEVEAELPDGAPENVVRIVTENSRTLKFNEHGFEET